MMNIYIRNIFVVFAFIICSKGFDLKLRYCRFRCSKVCETPEDKSNPEGSANPPEAYYWRDFYGTIPTDAYPLGPSTQFPQTYIGLAYDPSKNGTFVTTIYDGLDYVYTVLKNETSKIDKHIQMSTPYFLHHAFTDGNVKRLETFDIFISVFHILCTKSPGQLSWVKLTSQNFKTITATQKQVRGAYHMELVNNEPKSFSHFVVKTNKCHITYAGAAYSIGGEIEYALIDGSSDNTDQFLWLIYKDTPENNPSEPSSSKTFFSHHYDYQIRPDSIVPKFYKQINIGSCSVTCTNEDQKSMGKIKNDVKLSASMAYYWKPNSVINEEEAFPAGVDYGGSKYVGQAYVSTNMFDVGSTDLKSVGIREEFTVITEDQYFHVLSTNYPEALTWVNTTDQDFSNQDKNKMIPGGARDNGTDTFVCREVDKASMYPGSARELETGTYCYSEWGPVGNFQILMYNPQH